MTLAGMVRGGRPTQEAARSAASFIFKQTDHAAYWQILFQTVSDAAGSVGNRLRLLGRGNGGLAGRHRLTILLAVSVLGTVGPA